MLIYENQYYTNTGSGFAVVEFPFAAGLHKSKGCTRTDLVESRINSKGGLRIRLKLSQASLLCLWPRYSATLSFKHPSNPTTRIVVDSKGQLAYYPINGAAWEISQADGIATPPPLKLGITNEADRTYFAVGSSSVEVEASNGDKAIATGPILAIASPSGITLLPLPLPEYRFEPFMGKSPHSPYQHGRVWVEEPNTAIVDGNPVKSGKTVWPVGEIEVRSPLIMP